MTLMVSRRGARSMPRSAGVSFSKGFFFAFMMLGKDAYLGSENKAFCEGTAYTLASRTIQSRSAGSAY